MVLLFSANKKWNLEVVMNLNNGWSVSRVVARQLKHKAVVDTTASDSIISKIG